MYVRSDTRKNQVFVTAAKIYLLALRQKITLEVNFTHVPNTMRRLDPESTSTLHTGSHEKKKREMGGEYVVLTVRSISGVCVCVWSMVIDEMGICDREDPLDVRKRSGR